MFPVILATLLATLVSTRAQSWTLTRGGNTGVSAMQMTVASLTNVVIIDKFEQNPLHDGRGNPVWGAVYSTQSNQARPLHLETNSFCASGTWLSNGTLANIGGNARVAGRKSFAPNGLQGVRLFNPCADNEKCDVYENPQRIRLTSSRWYPSTARLPDGSVFICGGARGGGWSNYKGHDNPTVEFFPPKNIHGYNGLQIPLPFLRESLPHNLFPHIMLLPDDELFIAANHMAIKYNWKKNTEFRLPDIPDGQKVTYPLSGVGVLLPLTYENNYKPEVLLCGGSELSEKVTSKEVSAQFPASRRCARIVLDSAGIAAGWKSELMPEERVMPDAVILPDGKILIVNGAKTGTAGYGNAKDRVGESNADHPVFTPVLYDPNAPAGRRFDSKGMPTSSIARMYHSALTLLPDGRVMIAGSNPNNDVTTAKYPTEYQVEYIHPPYMSMARPAFDGLPETWNYGQHVAVKLRLPPNSNSPVVTVSLMDLGFSTHGVHMDMRMVKLKCTLAATKRALAIEGPPSPAIYPPGPAWVFVLVDGVPSIAHKVLIGNGRSPPVDEGAIANMLANTPKPNGSDITGEDDGSPDTDENSPMPDGDSSAGGGN